MNKMIIFVGPRGVGKDTLVQHVVKKHDQCKIFISMTTREKRPEEVEGEHYYFVTKEEFERKIDNDEFAEYDYHFNAYYGSPKKEIEEMWSKNITPVTDVDFRGAEILKERYGDSVLIVFIKVSDFEVLEKRMRSRSTENKGLTEQHIQEAKERYEKEITFESHADIVLINDDLEKAKSLTDEVVEAYTKA